jgi:hypothetical protein
VAHQDAFDHQPHQRIFLADRPLVLITPMRRNPKWGRWYLINIAAVLLAILGSFGRGGGLPDGLVQRVVDAIVFAWFVIVSIRLIQASGRSVAPTV